MNLIGYAITLALAIWPRRAWPVAAWWAVNFLINFSAYFIAADGDPRKSWVFLLTPSFVQLVLALIGRGFADMREGGPGLLAHAGYQLGAFATLIVLLFFNGEVWTWWNWIFIIPVSFILAELWPGVWLIILGRGLFG